MEAPSVKPNRVIGIFMLACLNLAVITSLRNMPLVAQYGLSLVSYYLLATFLFIIPTALVSAELATGWPKAGGVYIWCKEAFGEKWGFTAIWLQWVHNLPWYPAMLSFVGILLAYAFNLEHLLNNKFYTLSVVLIGFWGITLFNFLGIRTSGWLSSFCVIIGSVIPGAFLISLGIAWLIKGEPSSVLFSWKGILPNLGELDNIAFLTGTFLAFAGLELTAVHAKDVKDPKKNYPKAIFLSALFSLILFVLGSLSIAVVLPVSEISIVAGIMEAFAKILDRFALSGLVPWVALLIACGAIGELNAWILGLAKGLFITGRHGSLPPFFQKVNKHQIPTNILIFQAIISSLAAVIFLFMSTLNAAYWILIVLSAQLYLGMYLIMFLAGIRLRYTKPEVERKYRISNGNFGMWLIAGVGAVAAVFAILIGFIPPASLDIRNLWTYEIFMVLGFLILTFSPLLLHKFRKPSWMPTPHNPLLQGESHDEPKEP